MPGLVCVPGLSTPAPGLTADCQTINPISRLIQIQQAKKEKEPVYTLIAERGMPRRREFVMQVARPFSFKQTIMVQMCIKF